MIDTISQFLTQHSDLILRVLGGIAVGLAVYALYQSRIPKRARRK